MKKTMSIILVLAVLFGMVTVFAAGTEADPLISQTYAETTYRASFGDYIRERGAVLSAEPMLDIRLDEISENVGFELAQSFTRRDFGYLTNITLLPGSSFTLMSGTARIIYPSGSVINVSKGDMAISGTPLAIGERYFCGENTTATVISMSVTTGYVDGYYKVDPFMTTMFVERLYTEVLGRQYDENGVISWTDGIMSGYVSAAEVARGFIFSPELTGRNLSNADFVEMMYRVMLGRPSDPLGKEGWVNGLNVGMSRQAIFDGFVVSAEWNNICRSYGLVQSSEAPIPIGIKVFVTRLYNEVLGRQPDLRGREDWMRALQSGYTTGSQVAHGFIFSPELIGRNLSNDAFVELMYRTMLGRPSDPVGKADWVNALGTGMTRQDMYNAFVNTPEFAEVCRVLDVKK